MIQTLRQYAHAEHARMRDEYGVTVAEAADCYPREFFRAAWWDHVVAQVEAGVWPTTGFWRRLTAAQQRDLLRTRRALRDADFAGSLARMTAH